MPSGMVCVGSPDRIHRLGKLTLRDGLSAHSDPELNNFPNSFRVFSQSGGTPAGHGLVLAAHRRCTFSIRPEYEPRQTSGSPPPRDVLA
jgi:hypothetical protein